MADIHYVHAGFGAEAVPYEAAWERQRELHADRVADLIPDTALLLEHQAVYTAGRRTEPADRPVDGTPVVETDRGGKITWHGPGQLTVYPIVKLPAGVYVVDYVRRLETAIIDVCADLGCPAGRVPGRSGVWVGGGLGTGPDRGSHAGIPGPERKVAAIGVRVTRGVTMHGFAINCDCDRAAFDRIVPCGIRDAAVGTLSGELGRPVTVGEVAPLIERRLTAALHAPVASTPGTSTPGTSTPDASVPGPANAPEPEPVGDLR